MAWAIITIYISKCAQTNPQQLPKTSKFYSKCKKCDIEKTLGGEYHPPLVARRLKGRYFLTTNQLVCFRFDIDKVIFQQGYYDLNQTISTSDLNRFKS